MERVCIIDNSTGTTYYLSGVKEISPVLNSNLTEYPIPDGGYIGDHVYRDPNTINMSIMCDSFNVTNSSYKLNLDGTTSSLTYKELKELLNTWINEGTQLDIQTVHKYFRSMCLIGCNWREGKDAWSQFNPTLSFKELKIAQLVSTSIKALSLSYGADYSIEESTGETNGTEVNAEVTSESVVGGTLAGAATGAGLGAVVGSVIPVIGTAAGAVIGGVAGAVIGFFTHIEGD